MSLIDVLTAAKPPFGTPPFAPPPMETGSSQIPTTADNLPVKHGLSGFLDRFLNPQNALGQFGRALVMAGGTPIGNAFALMDQQRRTQGEAALERQLKLAELAHTQAETQHLGDGPAPDDFTRTLIAGGIDPASPEGKAAYHARAVNMFDPVLPQVVHDEDPVTHTITDRVIGVPTSSIRGSMPGAPVVPSQAPTSAPSPGLSSADNLWPRMVNQESGGHQFGRYGQPLTSSAGAVGIAQIMPSTGPEAAALAGLPWDPNKLRTDPAYNEALGHAYQQKQLNDFHDPALAASAYNAGPGRTRQALRRGGPDGWQNYVPPETRAYVAAVAGPNAPTSAASAQSRAGLLAEASDAIAKGADPVKVHARLRELGVE